MNRILVQPFHFKTRTREIPSFLRSVNGFTVCPSLKTFRGRAVAERQLRDPDTCRGRRLGSSTALPLSAGEALYGSFHHDKKTRLLFQFFCCFWPFRRQSMDRPPRLRALNKSRPCNRSWMRYRVRWRKSRASYNGYPAALLRPLTRLRTSQLQSLPSNKTKRVQVEAEADSEDNRTRQDHQDLQSIFARPIRGAAYQ